MVSANEYGVRNGIFPVLGMRNTSGNVFF